MDRRAFIGTLTGGLLAAPLVAEAQQPTVFRVGRVGRLTAYSSSAEAVVFESFRRGMRELGYEQARHIVYEARCAEGNLERLPGLAAEFAGLRMDVLAVANGPDHPTRGPR